MSNVKICPICGERYSRVPAISRTDNKTEICPDCGIRQALETIGVFDRDEQDHIMELAAGGTEEPEKPSKDKEVLV